MISYKVIDRFLARSILHSINNGAPLIVINATGGKKHINEGYVDQIYFFVVSTQLCLANKFGQNYVCMHKQYVGPPGMANRISVGYNGPLGGFIV